MIHLEIIKKGSIFFILLSLLMGVGVYQLKNRVSETAHELHHVKSKIQTTKESLHVLRAEWGFLKSPKRLARLNQKYLHLEPVRAIQIASLQTLNHRMKHGIMVAYHHKRRP